MSGNNERCPVCKHIHTYMGVYNGECRAEIVGGVCGCKSLRTVLTDAIKEAANAG